jgi:hypothetical protein
MRRPTSIVLLFGSLALVLFPLGVQKPGMPLTLRADEPAYYMMAMSLAKDRDLRLELKDIQRMFDEFPRLPAKNVILMTDDSWRTVYYGKPYVYSLINAPAAWLFGANGMVAMNMAMMSLMIWLGFVYLRRYNSELLALGFAVGFFVLSSAFAYTYWMHPEIFNMTSVMLCLFFAFHRFQEAKPARGVLSRLLGGLSREPLLPVWSGAALALGVYNKPMLLAFSLPAVWVFYRRSKLRGALTWIAAFAVMMGLICGLSIALTGHPSAYLGVWRAGPPIEHQGRMPDLPVGVPDPASIGRSGNSWEWLIRIPEIKLDRFLEDLQYFFVGRHTGLFPYMPFTMVALILFLIHNRGSRARWAVVLALASIAIYFQIFIPHNWHGGGGFIGNRYFVMTYPAFLFLVTALKPVLVAGVGYAFGGLMLGGILTTPFGAPVRNPTLQAHVRNPAFSVLPLEFSLRAQIPGYRGDGKAGAWFWGRNDQFRPRDAEFLLHGGTTVELWMMVREPLEAAVFQVRNQAAENRVEIDLGGDRQVLEFSSPGTQQIELRPSKPHKIRHERGIDNHIYRLAVKTRHVQVIGVAGERGVQQYPLGVRLTYLGTPDDLAANVFAIDWEVAEVPTAVESGRAFELPVTVTNSSEAAWPHRGAAKVQLAYHWLDAQGETTVREGVRTPIPGRVEPGETISVGMEILAPTAPGRYTLVLDAVRERVAWFSARDPEQTYPIEVEVFDGELSGPVADDEGTD